MRVWSLALLTIVSATLVAFGVVADRGLVGQVREAQREAQETATENARLTARAVAAAIGDRP